MNDNKQIQSNNDAGINQSRSTRKTIYDGVKITPLGADILIVLTSLALMLVLILALIFS